MEAAAAERVEVVPLDPNGNVSVGCLSFVSADTAAKAAEAEAAEMPVATPKAIRIDAEDASSEASSEDTCELPTEIVPEVSP